MNRGWWTKYEIVEALRLRRAGASSAEIGRALNRTALAVSTFLCRFGAEARVMRAASPRTRRSCLRCGKRFLSHGNGNRVCDPCKDKPSWSSGQDYHLAT